jgi:cytosine/uracil/thiamine/allantoin permease
VINIMGYFRSGGRLDVAALQCFANPSASRYGYRRGFNLPAILAWALAVLVGLPFSANSLFVGPAAAYFHGVDLSVVVSALVGVVIYSVFGRVAPYPSSEADTDPAGPGQSFGVVPAQTTLPHL